LTYYGALRREEVLNIKPMDFNLEDIKADHDALVKILITKAKFGKQRNVYIPKLLFKGLMIYIEEKQINKDARIFDVSRERWWGIFKDVCIKLGFITHEKDRIKYMYHPHSLRHSRSTEWYKSGVDIIGIRDRLGHSDISTTMEYIHPDKEKEGKRWGEEYEKINRI
jgi:integrase